MSDSRVNKAIQENRVPADVDLALLYESRDSQTITAIIVLTAVTFFVICCRLLSRMLILKRCGLDDMLALMSMFCLVAFVGLCIELINLGSGRHYPFIRWVLSVDTVLQTQVLDYVAHIIYTVALLLCRISGLAFYYRICGLHDRFLLAIKIVLGILIAGFLPQILLIVFHCSPVTGYWPYGWEPIAENYKCLEWGLVYSVNSAVSLLCDILLFGIPIVMLWILEMPRKRKIQLACILLPGTTVVIISITRLVLVILGQWQTDQSWSYNPMLAVEVSEIGATLIALSIPGAKPLFDRVVFNKTTHEESTTGPSDYRDSKGRNRSRTQRSRGTRLSTFRTHHSTMHSQDHDAILETQIVGNDSSNSVSDHDDLRDGIYVKMDFDVHEEMKPASSRC